MNDSDRNLIELYLEGNLPADKWEEFSHRLEQSADMRREFRKLSVLDENLRAQSIGFPNLAEREQITTPPATFHGWSPQLPLHSHSFSCSKTHRAIPRANLRLTMELR